MKQPRGLAALIVMIIIAGVALVLALSASLLGLNELETSLAASEGQQTLAWADDCLSFGLNQLRLDTNYRGQSLSQGGKSCIIEIEENSGLYDFRVTANRPDYQLIISAEAQFVDGLLAVSHWQIEH